MLKDRHNLVLVFAVCTLLLFHNNNAIPQTTEVFIHLFERYLDIINIGLMHFMVKIF